MGKPRQSFGRPSRKNPQRDRLLIVCEDEKHAPRYFEALRDDLLLTAADVRVSGKCKSAPSKVYGHAKALIDKDIEKQGAENTYDCAYCVFDKDEPKDYERTMALMAKEKTHKGVKVIPIPCVPCFELWILLHFTYTTKPLNNSEVVTEVLRYIPKFSKDAVCLKQLYNSTLKTRTGAAIKNAEKTQKAEGSSFTDIHHVVGHMIKESKK